MKQIFYTLSFLVSLNCFYLDNVNCANINRFASEHVFEFRNTTEYTIKLTLLLFNDKRAIVAGNNIYIMPNEIKVTPKYAINCILCPRNFHTFFGHKYFFLPTNLFEAHNTKIIFTIETNRQHKVRFKCNINSTSSSPIILLSLPCQSVLPISRLISIYAKYCEKES